MTDDLTGLSKDAYNATLYFDNKIFSARVAAAYRSDYLTTVPGRNSNDVEGTAATMNIDFSSSYNINDHFSVSLEALNLTDEVQDQWVGAGGRPPVVLPPPGHAVLPGRPLQVLVRSGTAPYVDAIEWGQKKFCPHFCLRRHTPPMKLPQSC